MLTAGTIIKKERERQNLSLEEISAATKIQKHYLESLEKDDYDKFPSSVYAKGFLRNYSRFLGLDSEKVIALFRRSVENEAIAQVKDSKRTIQKIKFALTPSTAIVLSIVLLIVFTFGYLFYQFYNFQKPPDLTITNPKNNSTVEESEITIEGKTEINMFVTINDEPVKINDDGSFKVNTNLSEGQNTLIIKAKHPDDIGKEAVVSRLIEYRPKIEEDIVEDVAGENIVDKEPTKIDVVIEISQESTWLDIKIDGKPEITSIVLPGTKLEYQAEKTFSITTGKVPSTKITINGEEKAPFITDAGIGIIECTIENEILNCQQP